MYCPPGYYLEDSTRDANRVNLKIYGAPDKKEDAGNTKRVQLLKALTGGPEETTTLEQLLVLMEKTDA